YGAPVKLGANQIGTLRIGVSTAGLAKELQSALSEAGARADRARNRVLMVSLVVLAIGVVLAALQGVRLAQPIKALTFQAEQLASGNLQARVAEGRSDELGVLARTFNMMTAEINALLIEQGQKASL